MEQRSAGSRTIQYRRGPADASIRIVEGDEAAVRLEVLRLATGEARPLVVDCPAEPWESWSGVRRILARLVASAGEEAVTAALERHPGPARLVLDRWRPRRPEAAERESAALAARIDSHLTHNWTVQRPVMNGWARILAELVRGGGFCLVVPYVNLLDWETLATLKSLYRQPRASRPRLVVGHGKDLGDAERDGLGIEWRLRTQYVREAVLGWLGRRDARCIAAPEPAGPAAAPPADPLGRLPDLAAGLEREASAVLADPANLDPAACEQVVEALEACFRRFGFTAALWLGLELFRRVPGLSGELAARAHEAVALSAHNRQFHSEGNTALGELIAAHLEAAIAQERRPLVRCALLYRLTVAYGRRLGKLEDADRWAECATAEAERAEPTAPRYQAVWARNIHAYVHGRRKNGPQARQCMQEAFALVSAPRWEAAVRGANGSELGGADLALTRSLVAHNLAVTEAMGGDAERSARTLETACALENEIEGSAKYWAMGLVHNLRRRHRPDLALPQALLGLRAAAKDREASLELYFLLQLADLAYRAGRPLPSSRYFLAGRRLTARLEPLADGHPDLDLPAAAALEDAGRLDLAEAILRSKLGGPAESNAELSAEVSSRLAVVAARRNDPDAADAWADRASEAAADDAHRHCLVRTAVHLGRAARLLERRRQAEELLTWALQLVEDRQDPESVAPAEELLVLTELHRCRSLTAEQARRTVLLVPRSLSSPAAWWALPDALEIWLDHGEGLELGGPEAPDPALQLVLTAGESRDDCRAGVRAVRAMLDRRTASMTA